MLNISEDKIKGVLSEDQFYSLRTLKTPELGRMLAKVLLVVTFISILFLFLPWQQNIRGTGLLTALSPANRPQTIESAIAGRIINWGIAEGAYVKKGDTILTLAEVKEKFFDPNLLLRLEQQIEAKEASLAAKEQKQIALRNQINALQNARRIKLSQATNKLDQDILKLQNDSMAYEAEKIGFENTKNIFDRNKQRYEAGNLPLNKFRELESKYQSGRAKIVSAENKWFQSQSQLAITRADIPGYDAEYLDKISKSESELSATIADQYETEGSLAKLRNEYSNMVIRNNQYQIIAPQNGYLVKTLKSGIGETIKEGEAVAIIMPDVSDMAAEMYIQAMDLPFISIDRKVRVQFDGWPVLQFSGWPNVSVGTFGGIVQVIDRVDSKAGKFRILVKPDPNEEPWPDKLRIGSGIKGWVMLDNVQIWYELWRQLNGFPPSVYNGEEEVQTENKK
ncbi:MAG: adhesin transport system membrane fusion protein [Cyclobacteriaceae bacterium]|jgi:adhesin transport system membrane fusion protein